MKTEESLKLIEETIASAKGNMADDSIFYLIWGWLVILASSINFYLLEFTTYENHWLPWPYLMAIGAITSAIVGSKKEKERKVKTNIEHFISSLWVGLFIAMIVLLIGMGIQNQKAIYPDFLLLYGIGTFVCGMSMRFYPLWVGAIICWICYIFALHTHYSNQLLLFIVAMVFSYLVPAYWLRIKYKKNV